MISRARGMVGVVGALVAVMASGCYGAHALPGASTLHVHAVPPAAGAPSSDPCAGRQPQPVNTTWSVDVGGAVRDFIVHVPRTYDPSKPTPLVFNFHGYTMTPKLEDWLTQMAAKADAAGFIVVFPEGTGSPSSFNAGHGCCGDAEKNNTDDVGYTRKMLDRLETDLCVDSRRVFATGMSNGGFMSHRLACEMSDRIAAVAPVAGVNVTESCTPPRAVPVLDFHGTKDPTVPYGGKPERHWLSVEDSIAAWVTRDGCTGDATEALRTSDTVCTTHTQCKDGAEVELCTVSGGGHTWPGGAHVPGLAGQGNTTQTVSADDLIWSFFQRHPMPESKP